MTESSWGWAICDRNGVVDRFANRAEAQAAVAVGNYPSDCRVEFAPAPDLPYGWPHREYEALPPFASEHFGAALVERQLVVLFSTYTDDAARAQLAEWNIRLDWDRVIALRELAQAAADTEWAMPEATYEDTIAADDKYREKLRSLALDARRTAAVRSVETACEADAINGAA